MLNKLDKASLDWGLNPHTEQTAIQDSSSEPGCCLRVLNVVGEGSTRGGQHLSLLLSFAEE